MCCLWGGASPPAGVLERLPETQRGPQGREPPLPSLPGGGGRTTPALLEGVKPAGPGRCGAPSGAASCPRSARRPGEPAGRVPPASPRRERSRRDPSRPVLPLLLPGGAQSWPGPGLPRRPSRGPGRTGARRKEPPPPPPPPLPRRAQPGTHPRETAAAGGEGPGEGSPSLPRGLFRFFFSSLSSKLFYYYYY